MTETASAAVMVDSLRHVSASVTEARVADLAGAIDNCTGSPKYSAT